MHNHKINGNSWILYLFLFFPGVVTFFSCANQGYPTGGPRDSIPPTMVNSYPPHESVNVKKKEFELIFDEYVEIRQLSQELIITPPIENYEYTVNKNTVNIEIMDTLRDSTTYTLNFGEAITDITENNPAKNMVYAFSTGPFIDSLSMGGYVKNLLTKKPQENTLVGLYNNHDTVNLFNSKPTYFAKTNEKGQFLIQNIKEGNYKFYAYKDKNDNLFNESNSEPYAFQPDPVKMEPEKMDSLNSDSIKTSITNKDTLVLDTTIHYLTKKKSLELLKADARPLRILNSFPTSHYYEINLNKPVNDYNIKPFENNQINRSINEPVGSTKVIPDSLPFVHNFQENQSVIRIYNTLTNDSVRALVKVRDSLNQTLKDTFYLKFSKTTREPAQFAQKTTVENQKITNELDATINFNKPVKFFFKDSISISYDSINILSVDPEKDLTFNKRGDQVKFKKEINKREFLNHYVSTKYLKDSLRALKKQRKQKSYQDSLNNASTLETKTHYLKQIYSLQNNNKPRRLLDSLQIVNNKNLWTKKLDSLQNTLVISDTLPKIDSVQINYNKPEKEVVLNFKKGTFISIENDTSKKIIQNYTFLNRENFGTIRGTVETDHTHYYIQLIKPDFTLVKEIYKENPPNKNYVINHVEPGDYLIRVLVDSNKNGNWDKGNILKNIPPEPVYIYNEKLEIRANWERQEIELIF